MKRKNNGEEQYLLSWPAIYALVAGLLILLIIGFGLFTQHFT